MKEDLISFETAALAKEQEFDIQTEWAYQNKSLIHDSQYKELKNWNELSYADCSAPTQSLLQKWIREKHKIDIFIIPYHLANKKYYESVVDKYDYNITYSEYNTYEEALEIGLQESLKIIKP